VTLTRRIAGFVAGRRTKWLVLLAWVFLGWFAVVNGPKLADAQQTDPTAFLPEDAESTLVAQADRESFRDSDLVPAVIVYERVTGITDADRNAAERDRDAIAEVEGVVPPLPPVVESKDGKALQLTVLVDPEGEFRTLSTKVDGIRDVVSDDIEGLTVKVAGPAAASGDFVQAFSGVDTRLLLFTALVVIIILLITYRSPVLWLFPIFTVLLADYLAQGVNYILASRDVFVVSGQTASILLILVFGAGTDYALLLISRYREELRIHEDRHEAMTEALARSAGAIAASAMTVALGLLTLVFSSLESTRGLGPVAAIGIGCALIAALTLLPALLVVAGRWVFWPFVPRFGSEVHEESGLWSKVGALVSVRPRAVWIVVTLLLGAIAWGATGLNTSGIPARDQFRTQVDSVAGQAIISERFDAGQGTPVVVIAPAEARAEVLQTLEDEPGIARAQRPIERDDLIRVEAVLADAPDTQEADQTVLALRAAFADSGTGALVGGSVAGDIDESESAARDRWVVIPLVLLVVLIVLIALLKAVTAPVVLVATVVLSFFAALGISAAVFQSLLGFTNVDENYVLFAFIFLVALGIDYNIFLMTRVREESARIGTRAGVLRGLAVTGGVITSAGVVLAATFAVLGTLPITPLFQLGLTVAIGVLLDTIVVRSVLVPALALDLGPRIWWPSALWRKEVTAPPPVQEEILTARP
jgi:putative drug exporter of the RND superfamily